MVGLSYEFIDFVVSTLSGVKELETYDMSKVVEVPTADERRLFFEQLRDETPGDFHLQFTITWPLDTSDEHTIADLSEKVRMMDFGSFQFGIDAMFVTLRYTNEAPVFVELHCPNEDHPKSRLYLTSNPDVLMCWRDGKHEVPRVEAIPVYDFVIRVADKTGCVDLRIIDRPEIASHFLIDSPRALAALPSHDIDNLLRHPNGDIYPGRWMRFTIQVILMNKKVGDRTEKSCEARVVAMEPCLITHERFEKTCSLMEVVELTEWTFGEYPPLWDEPEAILARVEANLELTREALDNATGGDLEDAIENGKTF
jgi:hypothetical protein